MEQQTRPWRSAIPRDRQHLDRTRIRARTSSGDDGDRTASRTTGRPAAACLLRHPVCRQGRGPRRHACRRCAAAQRQDPCHRIATLTPDLGAAGRRTVSGNPDRWVAVGGPGTRWAAHRRCPSGGRTRAYRGGSRRQYLYLHPRLRRHRARRCAHRHPDGPQLPDRSPVGDQRNRGVVGPGRRFDTPTTKSRNASRGRRRCCGESDRRPHRSDGGQHQPVRLRAAAAAGPGVHRAHRRGRTRRHPGRAHPVQERDRSAAQHDQPGTQPGTHPVGHPRYLLGTATADRRRRCGGAGHRGPVA